MAGSNTFGGTIKLEGEKAYREALRQINSELKVMASEMGKVTAEFSKNDKSASSLTSRNKILAEQIDKQKEKITALKNALEQSSEKYGENDKKTNAWKISLNKAEAELIKLEKELGDNEKVLKDSKNATEDNSKSLKKFGDSANDAGQKALKLGDLIKANLISDAIISGIKALGSAIMDVARKFGEFVSNGIKNASNLQEVQNVVDVTFEESAGIINDWATKAASAYGMSELSAKQYTGTIGAMFKSMGLADEQVLSMSTDMVGLAGDFASFYNLEHEEAFNKIRAGISGETEPLKQLGINMSVANLEAFALFQGIDKSHNSMTQAEQATLRYNYLMSVSADAQGDFARTSGSYANQLRIAQLNMENLATGIGAKLLPICNEALTIFNDMFSGTMDISTGFSKLTEMVVNLANDLLNSLPQIAETAGQIITSFASGITAMLPQLVPVATSVITTLVSTFSSNVAQITTAAVQIILTLAEALINSLPELLNAAIQIVVALVNGITQALPVLVPAIVSAVILMVNTLLANVPLILQTGIDLLMALVDAIPTVVTALVQNLPTIITTIIDALIESIPLLIGAAIELFMALVEAIPIIVVELVKALPQIVTAIIQGLARLSELLWNILTECVGKFISWGDQSENEGAQGSQSFLTQVINIIKELPARVWEWLQNAITNISSFFNDILNTAAEMTPQFVNTIISFVSELPGKIWDGIIGAVSAVTDWGNQLLTAGINAAQNLVNSIWSTLCELPGQMLDIGKNLVQGLWNGINDAKNWVLDKIKGFGESILNGIKSFFGIASPSKLFEEQIGKNLALGLGEGFTDSMKSVSKQMQNSIPTEFGVEPTLNVAYNQGFAAQPQVSGNSGITVHIENFVNNRAQDVQAFAQELEFYSRRNNFALG